jgi:hypothetical protein
MATALAAVLSLAIAATAGAQECEELVRAGSEIDIVDLHLARAERALDTGNFALAGTAFLSARESAGSTGRAGVAQAGYVVALISSGELDVAEREARDTRLPPRDQQRLEAEIARARAPRRLDRRHPSVSRSGASARLERILSLAAQNARLRRWDLAARQYALAECIRPRITTRLLLAQVLEHQGDVQGTVAILDRSLDALPAGIDRTTIQQWRDRLAPLAVPTVESLCRLSLSSFVHGAATAQPSPGAFEASRTAWCLSGSVDHAFNAALTLESAGQSTRAADWYTRAGEVVRAECLLRGSGCPLASFRPACLPGRDVGHEIRSARASALEGTSVSTDQINQMLASSPMNDPECEDVRSMARAALADLETAATVVGSLPRLVCDDGEWAIGERCCPVGLSPGPNGTCVSPRTCGHGLERDGAGGCRCENGREPREQGACCWPEQGWDGSSCVGEPSCATGFERHGDGCRPISSEAGVLRNQCEASVPGVNPGAADSCATLATLYLEGGDEAGVPRDLDRGLELAQRACAGGLNAGGRFVCEGPHAEGCLLVADALERRQAAGMRLPDGLLDRRSREDCVQRALQASLVESADASVRRRAHLLRAVTFESSTTRSSRGRTSPLPDLLEYCSLSLEADPSTIRVADVLNHCTRLLANARSVRPIDDRLITLSRRLCLWEPRLADSREAEVAQRLCENAILISLESLETDEFQESFEVTVALEPLAERARVVSRLTQSSSQIVRAEESLARIRLARLELCERWVTGTIVLNRDVHDRCRTVADRTINDTGSTQIRGASLLSSLCSLPRSRASRETWTPLAYTCSVAADRAPADRRLLLSSGLRWAEAAGDTAASEQLRRELAAAEQAPRRRTRQRRTR